MDKSNHTVTVPREYIEKLEAFYEENIVAKDFNLKGMVIKQGIENVLLIWNCNVPLAETVTRVTTLDSNGKEISKFILDISI